MYPESEYWLNYGTFHLSLIMTEYICLGGDPNVQKWIYLLNYSELLQNRL